MKSRRTRVHRARVAVAIQQLVAIAGEGSSGGDESEADGPPRKRRRRERKQVARCGRVCAEEAGDDWRNLSHFVSFCAVVWCATQQAHGVPFLMKDTHPTPQKTFPSSLLFLEGDQIAIQATL